MSGLSESRFNMWRGVVAFAHADHKVEPEERQFITKFFDTVDFSYEQQLQLLEELEEPVDINEIFPKITNPEDRSELILFARMMCWSDGDFAKQEEEILKKIHGEVMRKIDLDLMMKQTEDFACQAAKKREAELEAEQEEARGKVGLGAVIGALGDQVKGFLK